MVYFKVIILLAFVSEIYSKMQSVEEIEYNRWNPLLIRRSFRPYLSEKQISKDTIHYFNEFTNYYNYKFKNLTGKKTAFSHFTDSLKKTAELNERNETAIFKVNEFSILTLKKFLSLYTGFNDSKLNMTEARNFNIEVNQLPKELDYRGTWVEAGAYDQGECRSSYVFSAIQNIEAQLMKSFKYKSSLSVQYAFECERAGNCVDGGLPHLVMEGLMKTGVLETDKYIAYSNSSHEKTCKTNQTAVAKVTGYYIFTFENEEYLKNALALYGPLSIAINVGDELKYYYSGVLNPTECSHKPNHAVLLVGYGTTNEDGTKYWIIRNSWGSGWGENGFFRLIRGKWACGIGSYTATSTVEIITAGWKGMVTPIVLPGLVKTRNVTVDVKPEYSEYYTSLDEDEREELPSNIINSNESIIRNLVYLKDKFEKLHTKNITEDIIKEKLKLETVEPKTEKTKITKNKQPKRKIPTAKTKKTTKVASIQNKVTGSTDKHEPDQPKPTQTTEKHTTTEFESKNQKLKTSTTKDQKPTKTKIEKPATKEPKQKDHKLTDTKAEKLSNTKQVKPKDQNITKAKVEKSNTSQKKLNVQKLILIKSETNSTKKSIPKEQKANATNLEKPTTDKPKVKISLLTQLTPKDIIITGKPGSKDTIKSITETVGYKKKQLKQIESKNLLPDANKTQPNEHTLEKLTLKPRADSNEPMLRQPEPNAGVTKKLKPEKHKPKNTKLKESKVLTPRPKENANVVSVPNTVRARKRNRKRMRQGRRKYNNRPVIAVFGSILDFSIITPSF